MRLNKEWHQKHRMQSNASTEERLQWHLQHAKNCGCREIPRTILEMMKSRGMILPMGSPKRRDRS